jgi:hypothetical protein
MTQPQPHYPRSLQEARRVLAYGCLLPFVNAASAAALGALVVYSDAGEYPALAGLLSAANVGGWLWWLVLSLRSVRDTLEHWSQAPARLAHPGFRLVGMLSVCGAISWVGVLCLLAYGMLG